MRKRFWSTVLVLAPLIAAGSVLGVTTLSVEQATPPTEFVPFSAELRMVWSDGSTHVGRFYRDRNGSTREETGRSLDAIDTIAIKNIPKGEFYSWGDPRPWTVQPMDLPPQGWLPPPRSRAGDDWESSVQTNEEGLEVVRSGTAQGVFEEAPQLNFFPVSMLQPCESGELECGLRYFNIRVRDQPPEFFEPPGGVVLDRLLEPGGITRVQ